MKKLTSYQEKSRFDLCGTCLNMIDAKYCLHWRDIVPDDAKVKDCDGWKDNGEAPF